MRLIFLTVLLLSIGAFSWASNSETKIYYPHSEGALTSLAAKELSKYIYQLTGYIPLIDKYTDQPMHNAKDIILMIDSNIKDGYMITNLNNSLTIKAINDVSLLYGVYRYAELLGVRFYLHGDVVPIRDSQKEVIMDVDICEKPLFEVRGIQPFHDFPEGPDWWNEDTYMSYISQMVKMRMNFIGLHTYPENGPHAEPQVWIGTKDDIADNGDVKFSYEATLANTARDKDWGYAAMKSSEFCCGAAKMFEYDDYGSDIINRVYATDPQYKMNRLFNDTGDMFESVFDFGRKMGIKFCIGTETPLSIPAQVKEQMKFKGIDPDSEHGVRSAYEGIFTRLSKKYKPDYYWLWTPESWTWGDPSDKDVDSTMRDIEIAYSTLQSMNNPFGFALSGWVLGPPKNRSAFDNILPENVALSCINRGLGFDWIEPGFRTVKKERPLWAIPWMEDDPAMITPQLWVGRMRRDGSDALKSGCCGLIGIHWRTKIIAPNIAALAQSGWSQHWNQEMDELPIIQPTEGHIGGVVALTSDKINGVTTPEIYQSVRNGVTKYKIKVPKGIYRVTLKLCETYYNEPNSRVFDIAIGGNKKENIDIYQLAGKLIPLDIAFDSVVVETEELVIDFKDRLDHACIAAIEIDGKTADVNQITGVSYIRKINVGGNEVEGYESDLSEIIVSTDRKRDLPAYDFYLDFATTEFGASAAIEIAEIFTSLDGVNYLPGNTSHANIPRPAGWIDGPGGINVINTPWEELKVRYNFIDKLEKITSIISGEEHLERFDFWLNSFRYLRSLGRLGSLRGDLDNAVKMAKERNSTELSVNIIQIRSELSREWERMMTYLLETVATPGEMGTVANLEQHVRCQLRFLDIHDEYIMELNSGVLPDNAKLNMTYTGKPRIFMPTEPRIVDRDSCEVKAIILSAEQTSNPVLRYKSVGTKKYRKIKMTNVGRGVYQCTIPELFEAGTEYFITVPNHNELIRYPVSSKRDNIITKL